MQEPRWFRFLEWFAGTFLYQVAPTYALALALYLAYTIH